MGNNAAVCLQLNNLLNFKRAGNGRFNGPERKIKAFSG
jgi:hypothetical protein